MAGEKDELAKLAYVAQAYREQMKLLQQQLSSLQMALAENSSTIEALRSLLAGNVESVLLPLGSGAFAKAKISEKGSVLVEVGSGVIVEKGVGDAMALFEEKAERIKGAYEKVQKELLVFSDKLQKLDEGARKIVGKMKAEG